MAIFLRNFLQLFENSPASGGSAPGPPTRPAITLNPRNFFLRTPLLSSKCFLSQLPWLTQRTTEIRYWIRNIAIFTPWYIPSHLHTLYLSYQMKNLMQFNARICEYLLYIISISCKAQQPRGHKSNITTSI